MKDGPNGQGNRFYSVKKRSSFSHTVVLFFILSFFFYNEARLFKYQSSREH